MRKQQTLNSFFKPSSINPPNPVTKRNSDDDSIISTSPKKKHLNGSEIVEANNSIQRINDIGLFINCDLKNAEKNLILTNLWVPTETYKFPLVEKNKTRILRFQHRWLQLYKWLAYSEIKQGGFCKVCVVFSKTGGIGGQKLCVLVVKPMDSFKKALETLNNHANHEYHKLALLKADSFLNICMKKEPEIINSLNEERNNQVIENRKRLTYIIECVMLCGRQELALRGHRDFGSISFDDQSNVNEGNFREILKYKTKDIDHMKHFLSSDYRNKYISPVIQNEIINSCGDIILKKIVKEINDSGYFSVLADETTDVSVKEQLTLCVRYLVGTGKDINIHESFLKFTEVVSLTGENLASSILNGLNSCGINCDNICGQGYDGASNMSGHIKGVQTIIKAKYPKALYVHCVAHALNLAISSACNIQPIRNCLGTVQKMYCFFNFPKRQNVILTAIDESDLEPKVKTLKRLCATRWVQRYDAINDFVELFPYVVISLENISEWTDASSVDANLLLKSMDSTFLISLQIIKVLFSYGLPLCKQLQQIEVDLREAIGTAVDNVNALKTLRHNIDIEFHKMFEKAKIMAEFLDITISIKRLNKRQQNRANPLSNDKNELEPETYFRITICIPFIDAFIQQLEDRFLEHRNVFNGFQCLFSYDSDDTLVEFDELVKFYFPDSDIDTVRAELQMWNVKLKRLNIQPKTGLDALKYCSELIYPNLSKLFRIFCTLPVSTATPERMFSCLKRLKTYLRNTMKEERLNGLTLMAVHRNIPLSAEEVIDELTKKKRKLNFVL